MKLYFLRHGIAADAAAWRGADDDRPLTEDGKKRMGRQAKAMAGLVSSPEAVVTSPLLRARQTAEIVAAELGPRRGIVVDGRMGLDFDVVRLAEMLEHGRGAEAMMFVGHEPSMSETIGRLVGGARIDLKKGGLAYVDVPGSAHLSGHLVWLVPPKVLLGARS